MVEHQDVVTAVLGASAGLGGLTLVFLGLVVSTSQSLGVVTPEVTKTYRRLTAAVTADFVLSLLCVGAAAWWLIDMGALQWPYPVAVVLFAAQISLLGGVTVAVVWRLMWGD
jgi:hypothetical protein